MQTKTITGLVTLAAGIAVYGYRFTPQKRQYHDIAASAGLFPPDCLERLGFPTRLGPAALPLTRA